MLLGRGAGSASPIVSQLGGQAASAVASSRRDHAERNRSDRGIVSNTTPDGRIAFDLARPSPHPDVNEWASSLHSFAVHLHALDLVDGQCVKNGRLGTSIDEHRALGGAGFPPHQ